MNLYNQDYKNQNNNSCNQEQDLQNIINILSKLVEFKSISPNSDGSIEWVGNFLRECHFKVIEKTFHDVMNLYAEIEVPDNFMNDSEHIKQLFNKINNAKDINAGIDESDVMSVDICNAVGINIMNANASNITGANANADMIYNIDDINVTGANASNITSANTNNANSSANANADSELGFNLCFAGHLDVVPPMNNWDSNPFKLTKQNNILYARGAADMKGSIAVILYLLSNLGKQIYLNNLNKKNVNTISERQDLNSKQLLNSNLKKISILLTSDEEGEAKYGTNEMLKWLYANGYYLTHCIIGEPTSINKIGDNIKTGRKGSTNFELQVIGAQGHVAYHEHLQNANLFLTIFFTELQKYYNQYNQDDIHFEITELKCINNTTNLVPQDSFAKFNFRYNYQFNFKEIEKTIHTILKNIITNITFKKNFNSIIYKLHTNHAADSFLCNYKNAKINLKQILEKAILNVTNIKPNNINNGGTSDARFIIKYCQTIEIGLKYETAHKKNEHIYCNDLKILYNIYSIALKEILMYNN